jgi:hypothetical protein
MVISTVEGVIAVGGLLVGDRAGHGVPHQEHLDLSVVAPAERNR